MNNKYIWYIILLIYLVGLIFNYSYVSEEISKQESFIISLEEDFQSNDKKLDSLKNLKREFKQIDSLLNLLKRNKAKKSAILKLKYEFDSITALSRNSKTINENLIPKKLKDSSELKNNEILSDSLRIEIDKKNLAVFENVTNNHSENNIVENIDQKNDSIIEDETKTAPVKQHLFTKINGIYNNIKRPRGIKTNDNNIWIELESTYGNYSNSLRSMIKGITINGTYVHILDIREKIVGKTNNGYITNYYIQVKLPRVKIVHARNQLVIEADKTYYELFSAR